MSGIEPLVTQGDWQPTTNASSPLGSVRLLPSAAEIWSSRATAGTAEAMPTGSVSPDRFFWTGLPEAASPPPFVFDQRGVWPPRRLSLALQGGGSFGAFTWGVLERLLEETTIELDTISGTSAGAINGVLLASGLVEGGRAGARSRLARFWKRVTDEGSFRSLMLIGGFSPIGTSVAFGPALSPEQFDRFDLDLLREAIRAEVDLSRLCELSCPKLLIATTRVRTGQSHVFRNQDITADVVLASTCPPFIHYPVDIEGEPHWDGSYVANPPLLQLARESKATDVLVVQITPTHDALVPVTMAAIDRRLDQIMSNATLNSETAALDLAHHLGATPKLRSFRVFRIAAEDEIEGLAQLSNVDLGRDFIRLLHQSGRQAADRWLARDPDDAMPMREVRSEPREAWGATPDTLRGFVKRPRSAIVWERPPDARLNCEPCLADAKQRSICDLPF
jgi:NTE family protein